MKMVSKSGGKFLIKIRFVTLILLALTINGCESGLNKIEVIDSPTVSSNENIKKDKNGLPTLLATSNFNDLSETFTINKDTTINILAVGEGVDYSINKSLIKSYDNDCVEIYFDLLNNKYTTFDANGDDRQYRIVWKLLSVDGINNKNDGVLVREKDPNNNAYEISVAFPWKTLGFVKPGLNREIGFDVAIDDTDGGTRKALFAWNSTTDVGWENTSVYGTLILAKNAGYKSDKAISINTPYLNKADYSSSAVWKNVPKYDFKNVIYGYVLNDRDLAGYFQSTWNNEFLFVKVTVSDNIKRYAQVMFDYGWLETANGKRVWAMEMNQTKYAGGAKKNRMIDTSIRLKKGTYKVRYVTDESHSPGYWEAPPPKIPFYGIKLSYSKK